MYEVTISPRRDESCANVDDDDDDDDDNEEEEEEAEIFSASRLKELRITPSIEVCVSRSRAASLERGLAIAAAAAAIAHACLREERLRMKGRRRHEKKK